MVRFRRLRCDDCWTRNIRTGEQRATQTAALLCFESSPPLYGLLVETQITQKTSLQWHQSTTCRVVSTCQLPPVRRDEQCVWLPQQQMSVLPAVHVFITTDLLCLKTWMSRKVMWLTANLTRILPFLLDVLTPRASSQPRWRTISRTGQFTLLQLLPAKL